MSNGCKRKEEGGDLCPIVAEQAVKIVKQQTRLTELEAAIEADQYHINNQEQVIEGLRGRISDLETALKAIKTQYEHYYTLDGEHYGGIHRPLQETIKVAIRMLEPTND